MYQDKWFICMHIYHLACFLVIQTVIYRLWIFHYFGHSNMGSYIYLSNCWDLCTWGCGVWVLYIMGWSVTWFSIMSFNVSYVTPDPEGKNERVFRFVCFVLHFFSSLLSVMSFRYTVFQLVVWIVSCGLVCKPNHPL
jgi:hypothetical protein